MNRLQEFRKERGYRNLVKYLIRRIEKNEDGLSLMDDKYFAKIRNHPRYWDIFHEVMDETDRRNPDDLWDAAFDKI